MTQSYTDEFVDNAQNGSTARQGWLSTLAKAPASEVLKLWEAMVAPESQVLRPAETGMVMVRGRTGGAGNPFNLGEMTVTRCAIRLATGETGIGYVSGRDKTHAYVAAVADAMLQSPVWHDQVRHSLIEPLRQAYDVRRDAISRKAKATQVEFFTMVRDRKA
ncbi:phosphonate C-P lyase system protein PhnG [Aquidulcibacter sp.]|jgi:alpha-D-ribose 1-methylphosphonate 5-triphosphate synthase subunit PhnG|uniref:phosphonate C-P lyase system protein PhnG n=1 Tax=Aquidulcibacter sp. TaxID=2052990 RepID=UPI003784C542